MGVANTAAAQGGDVKRANRANAGRQIGTLPKPMFYGLVPNVPNVPIYFKRTIHLNIARRGRRAVGGPVNIGAYVVSLGVSSFHCGDWNIGTLIGALDVNG